MTDTKKKEGEQEILNKTFKFACRKGNALLKELKTGYIRYDESPDFIVECKKNIYGIEHFLVDTNFSIYNDKPQSNYKQLNNKSSKLIGKEITPKNITSFMKPVIDCMGKESAYSTYYSMISSLKRNCESHFEKIDKYKINTKKHNSFKNIKLCFIIEFAMSYPPIFYISNKKRINKINLNKGFISNDMEALFFKYIGKIDYLILYFHDYYFNSDNLIVLPMNSKRKFKAVVKKNYIFYNGTDKYNEFKDIIRYNFTLENIDKINKNQYVFNTIMDKNGESLKKCLETIRKTIFNDNKASNNIVIDIYTYTFVIYLSINIINNSIKNYNAIKDKYSYLLK